MVLTAEELDQIRAIVRSEVDKKRSRAWTVFALVIGAVFIGVIFFHVLVIGGFTLYHLLHK